VKRFLPDTVAGWIIVVLVSGLAVTQAATLAINASARSQTSAVLAHFHLAERMADLVRLVLVTPPAQRGAIVSSVRGGTLHVSWNDHAAPTGTDINDPRANLFSQVMQAALWDVPWRTLRVSFAPAPIAGSAMPGGRPSDRSTSLGRRLDSILAEHTHVPLLRVALQLDDGSWLNFEAPFVENPATVSAASLLLLAFAALAIIGASIWAVRRLTDPLVTLARAAERLGDDVNAPPLQERGARELRQAARAFNAMQSRLQQQVHDRLQMTAAISHDLRTPITRLRLRAELVADEEQRQKMLADLAHMEDLIGSTLAFASEDSRHEATVDVDLVSLVEDLCDDRQRASFELVGDAGPRMPYRCRPTAMRRCIGNLVDNALKYGHVARVTIESTAAAVFIRIADDGPGIPDADQERVFEPYQRLEPSRNEETGGAGLGLAIARMIARAHGGDIRLRNLPAGGLQAIIELPR
jgi:signal transduction histidine kinase